MAVYSIWVLNESDVTLSGNTVLDGVTQGDGSHLVGETLTINNGSESYEVSIRDRGSDTAFADNDRNQVLNGAQTIDGVTYRDGLTIEAEYQFVVQDPNTGLQYTILSVNVANSNPVYGTVEGLAFVGTAPPSGVTLNIISASEGPRGSDVPATEVVPLCLTEGALVETPTGPTLVECLSEGDLVSTYQGSPRRLRLVAKQRYDADALRQNPKLQPVRITAGALGGGLPKRDLLVSRQHRMLLSSSIAQRMFGSRNVLVPAIRLTALPGVYLDESVDNVTYFHLVFDEHLVLVAEGAPSESLYPGPEALKVVPKAIRLELELMFPELMEAHQKPQPAYPIPAPAQAKAFVKRFGDRLT